MGDLLGLIRDELPRRAGSAKLGPEAGRGESEYKHYDAVIRKCEAALRAVVDPEAVDRLARADQRVMIEKHGGMDAILKRGTFRYSPPPGVKASYY